MMVGEGVDPLEYCYQQGWTDGLPVVPPTPERVKAMLSTVTRDPHEVMAVFQPMGGEVTVEKAAINAVMAGCLPEYFPVVLAAAECLAEEGRDIGAFVTTIHGDAPLLIINGPVIKKLEFNSGANTFGPGWRANATVGRAISSLLRNVASGPSGDFDRATQTHPGKFTACIAEFEEASPWPPLQVDRGFTSEDSTVTLVAGQGPLNVTDMVSTTARGVLATIADSMSVMGTYNMYFGGEVVLVLSPTHAQILVKEGWSKRDVKDYLWEEARKPLGKLKQGGAYNWGGFLRWPKWLNIEDDHTLVPVVSRPEDIIVVVAGGEVGGYSSIVFCLYSVPSSTRRIIGM